MGEGAGEVPGWPIKGGKSEGRGKHNRMVKGGEETTGYRPGGGEGKKGRKMKEGKKSMRTREGESS